MKFNKKKITDVAMNIGVRAVAAPAGAIAASALEKIAFIANLNPWIKGIGKIIIGAAIPEFHNKPNDKMSTGLAAFGAGFSAVGGLDIAKTVMPGLVSGVVSGTENVVNGLTVDTEYSTEKVGDKEVVGMN
jgi:hypothetical protein